MPCSPGPVPYSRPVVTYKPCPDRFLTVGGHCCLRNGPLLQGQNLVEFLVQPHIARWSAFPPSPRFQGPKFRNPVPAISLNEQKVAPLIAVKKTGHDERGK